MYSEASGEAKFGWHALRTMDMRLQWKVEFWRILETEGLVASFRPGLVVAREWQGGCDSRHFWFGNKSFKSSARDAGGGAGAGPMALEDQEGESECGDNLDTSGDEAPDSDADSVATFVSDEAEGGDGAEALCRNKNVHSFSNALMTGTTNSVVT